MALKLEPRKGGCQVRRTQLAGSTGGLAPSRQANDIVA